MNRPFTGLWLSVIVISCIARAQEPRPFLSTLHATKDSPVFTTYAAPIERSEFALDKGYHFVFYDSARGADFTNQSGGDLCLAFKSGGKYVYEVNDMISPPVILASYADMVVYEFRPFTDISVQVTFLVYSSHHTLQAIDVKNTGNKTEHVEVLPFLRNTSGTYDSVEYLGNVSAMTFTHEELPDGWVLDHKVPYVGRVRDVYALSDPPDRAGSFRSYQWGPVEIPRVHDLQKQPVYLVWGLLRKKEGARCTGQAATSRVMVILNGDRKKILTETAPRWGSAENNLTPRGYYGIELGNFGSIKEGDRFELSAMCGGSDMSGVVNGVVRRPFNPDSTRFDIMLGQNVLPRAPEDLKMDIWGSGTEVRLYWRKDPEAVSYNVYRRDYRSGGVYELIGGNVRQTFYTDKDIPGDRIYGYVVTALDAAGRMSMHSAEVNNVAGADFLTDVRYPDQGVNRVKDLARIVAFSRAYDLRPGYMHRLIVVRSVGRPDVDVNRLIDSARGMTTLDLPRQQEADERLYSRIPPPVGLDTTQQMLYWGAFSLMRQVMLRPEGECHYNYYVFSREPQWGWGHGGQVFHESLTMLSYASMDPASAMNSQRVYFERQKPDGYINYRTGPYLDEEIPNGGQLTTSAPWFAWENWEVFSVTHDRKFLEEAYASSVSFYRYYVKNRDSDGDGLCEWGGDPVLESVRDGLVAVWDQVGSPENFEAVDLNTMLVQEAKTLGKMARDLGRPSEAEEWEKDARSRAEKINAMMWDEKTGFYYNVAKGSHAFTFKTPDDLKREEIIGFLPMWAGIADKHQAARLVEKLKDPAKFWRRFGVPSLAADDRYYDPKGYWNGPMWVQWDYLVVRGLLDYGYLPEAQELTRKVMSAMIDQLKKDHDFWEFYSPDEAWAGYHKTYIWAGIITRMMKEAGVDRR